MLPSACRILPFLLLCSTSLQTETKRSILRTLIDVVQHSKVGTVVNSMTHAAWMDQRHPDPGYQVQYAKSGTPRPAFLTDQLSGPSTSRPEWNFNEDYVPSSTPIPPTTPSGHRSRKPYLFDANAE